MAKAKLLRSEIGPVRFLCLDQLFIDPIFQVLNVIESPVGTGF